MSEKLLQSRLIQKHDTSANWAKATNFRPKKGEIIIYDDLKKIKIGDGTTLVSALPFINSEAAESLKEAVTITLNGDVSGSVSFDGSSNVTITTTVADDSHNHTIANIDNLQTTLAGKASTAVATTSADGLMNASDKSKLNGIATGAEANQNAFSNVKVGSTTIAADAKTDTLTLVAGSNVTITPDATNDKITIAATDTTSFSISAGATDDDVVILTGTAGTNGVSYDAKHATKGPSTTASTTKGPTANVTVSGSGASGSIKVPKVTTDKYGHTTGLTE